MSAAAASGVVVVVALVEVVVAAYHEENESTTSLQLPLIDNYLGILSLFPCLLFGTSLLFQEGYSIGGDVMSRGHSSKAGEREREREGEEGCVCMHWSKIMMNPSAALFVSHCTGFVQV